MQANVVDSASLSGVINALVAAAPAASAINGSNVPTLAGMAYSGILCAVVGHYGPIGVPPEIGTLDSLTVPKGVSSFIVPIVTMDGTTPLWGAAILQNIAIPYIVMDKSGVLALLRNKPDLAIVGVKPCPSDVMCVRVRSTSKFSVTLTFDGNRPIEMTMGHVIEIPLHVTDACEVLREARSLPRPAVDLDAESIDVVDRLGSTQGMSVERNGAKRRLVYGRSTAHMRVRGTMVSMIPRWVTDKELMGYVVERNKLTLYRIVWSRELRDDVIGVLDRVPNVASSDVALTGEVPVDNAVNHDQ